MSLQSWQKLFRYRYPIELKRAIFSLSSVKANLLSHQIHIIVFHLKYLLTASGKKKDIPTLTIHFIRK